VATSYFHHRKYWTHIDTRNDRNQRQLDYFLVSQSLGSRLTDAKVYEPPGGVISDHLAIRMTIRLARCKKKNKANRPTPEPDPLTTAPRYRPNWRLLHQDLEIRDAFAGAVSRAIRATEADSSQTTTPGTKEMNDIMISAAQQSIPALNKQKHTCWFAHSEQQVRPIRDATRQAYHRFRELGTTESKEQWHQARTRYNQTTRAAKKQYYEHLAVDCCQAAFRGDSRSAWKAIRTLQQGSKSHHRDPFSDLCLRDPETGEIATTAKANISILEKYCTKLYNPDDAPVDFIVLDEVPQQDMMHELGNPPDLHETTASIKK
jgi:hypothetical protein